MSIKNDKNAIELLSLILSLMDDDDRATCPESPLHLDNDEDEDDEWDDEDEDDTEPDPAYCDEDCDNCSACYSCAFSPFCDEDDEPEDEGEDDDALTIKITIPDGMPCIVMGGTDDELPLAMELIKEMGLVSPTPTPAPTKSRVRGEMVNRNQSVPESLSGEMMHHLIDEYDGPFFGPRNY